MITAPYTSTYRWEMLYIYTMLLHHTSNNQRRLKKCHSAQGLLVPFGGVNDVPLNFGSQTQTPKRLNVWPMNMCIERQRQKFKHL